MNLSPLKIESLPSKKYQRIRLYKNVFRVLRVPSIASCRLKSNVYRGHNFPLFWMRVQSQLFLAHIFDLKEGFQVSNLYVQFLLYHVGTQ